MKQSINKLLLSLILMTSMTCVNASKIEDDTPPKPVSNRMLDITFDTRQKELAALTLGITALSAGKNNAALEHFRKAIRLDGSPLGYLYASVLEPKREISRRYWALSNGARMHKAISNSHFFIHQEWIRSLTAK